MERSGLQTVLKYLRRQAIRQGGGISDGVLLDRYVHSRDEAAFELLLWRHGPLVQNVCRRLLRNEHDVDDAFQATFAALACRASTIRRQQSAAPWLYRVAYRAALAARVRSGRFVSVPEDCEPIAAPDDDFLWRDLRAVLDAEVQKLGEKYRNAFVLCCLEGLTHGEAATRLGCPEGTIHSRLATAKDKLRRGLERRGVTLSGTGMALEFAARHVGSPPTVQLIQETLTTAISMSAKPISGAVAKSSVVSLTKGVLFTMWMQTYAAPALVTLALGLVGIGAVGLQGKAGTKPGDVQAGAKPGQNAAPANKSAEMGAAKVDEAAKRTDVPLHAENTKLTDISVIDEPSANGIKKLNQATLHDTSKNRKVTLQTESKRGFDTFLVQEGVDRGPFKCKVDKINDRDLIFHDDIAYYRITVGSALWIALRNPLQEDDLNREGIQIEDADLHKVPDRAARLEQEKKKKVFLAELQRYFNQKQSEYLRIRHAYGEQRRTFSNQLYEKEEALRRLEHQITFERERERKSLSTLEDQESQTVIALEEATLMHGPTNAKVKDATARLDRLRLQIDKNTEVIKSKEEERSRAMIKARIEVDNLKHQLRNNEEECARNVSESQLAQLGSRIQVLQEELDLPHVPSITPRGNPEDAHASRLESKLDQVIHELAELKKLLAKPANER